MNRNLLIIFLFIAPFAKAQKVESIYVNLYTDSLKKGTYNYINIDGLLANGRYIPLDSSDIAFSCSTGKFYGNTLWLDRDSKEEKVALKAVLRSNPSVFKEFTIYVKKKEDGDLKTLDEIMSTTPPKGKKKRN